MEYQCPVDGCQNILRTPLAMNKLCRVDNETYICSDCGNAQAHNDLKSREWMQKSIDAKGDSFEDNESTYGYRIAREEEARSLLANNALHGHGWSYDLRAIAKEADAGKGGLEFWAGAQFEGINVMTDKGMRVLKNFECMHSARDIVEATYQHSGCDAYFEEKAATLKKHGLLYWSSELDTGNLSRLVHLINLYAHSGAQ